MCGIAGFYNINPCSDGVFTSMRHRGSDGEGVYKDGALSLYHARLAIQDVVGGAQPMSLDSLTIVFNGEIYNHLELRTLYLSNIRFDTHSDTETLLRLYQKYGVSALSMLDGMFAFCIYDKTKKTIFFARDRAGKKPLFIYQKNGSLAFASELNTIASQIPLDIDDDMIEAYLRCGFLPHHGSPYKDIASLPAASWREYRLDDMSATDGAYFDILELFKAKKQSLTREEMVAGFKERMSKSVKDRLLSSDLEVGAFLSGGIDSGLTVAFAREFVDRLRTFTVSFSGSFDESVLAKSVADKYETIHTQINIELNLKNDIEKILTQYGHPFFDSSAIPSWYVSREAKKHVTVILNGDGADELFGGYRRYVPAANNLYGLASMFAWTQSFLPKPISKMGKYNYLYRLLSISKKDGLDFYLSTTTDIFEDFISFGGENRYLRILSDEIKEVYSVQSLSPLSKLMYVDFHEQLFSDLLPKMDIATMAHALEGRSPFLSKYMLEFAPTLPDSSKINRLRTKSLLRDVAKEYLPPLVTEAPKRGFEVPLTGWVENELREMIFDYLGSSCYAERFIGKENIARLLEGRADTSRQKRAKMLWSMFALEIWHRGIKV